MTQSDRGLAQWDMDHGDDSEEKKLAARIKALEEELRDSHRDLETFREEVGKLNHQLGRFVGQLGEELKLASAIQKAMVPTEIPSIPGFEFSTKYEASPVSGGDYFDIFELEDKLRFGLLAASSSGHGISALFLSVLMKLAGQMEARQGRPPHEALGLLAAEMIPHIDGEQKASLFYGLFDRRLFELSYCVVGDVIALFSRHGTQQLEHLASEGPAIQKSWSAEMKTRILTLNPRDRLIVVTPGLVRIKNKRGESFGEERLYNTVLGAQRSSTHDLRNEIIFQAKRFGGDAELEKDVTVLVVEVQDRVIKLARK